MLYKTFVDDMYLKTTYFNDFGSDVPEEESTCSIELAYNDDGVLIGNWEDLLWTIKMGIDNPEPARPNGRVCNIGYSPSEKKWYGWSHRAYHGFDIGTTITYGCIGFQAANKEQFIESLKHYYKYAGDIFDGLKYGIQFHPVKAGVYISFLYPSMDDSTEIIYDFEPWPETWGRGVWTAKTLDDCKEMAIEFAKDVA
jgi:hypothetical protein